MRIITGRSLTRLLLGVMFITPVLHGRTVAQGEKTAESHPLYHRSGFLPVNRTRLFYEIIGSGKPILIVHGGPGMDHSYFLPQMASLARHYRLIFFDQRGSGKSAADVDSSSMTVNTFVADIDGVRRALHLGRVNLLGHSWGGLLAMRYALSHPDHLESLILVNPTPATSAMRDSSFAIMRERASSADTLALSQITSSAGFRQSSPETMTRFFRLLFKPTFADQRYVDSLTLQFPLDYAVRRKTVNYLNRDATVRSYDLRAGLRDLRCRALIIGGDHDMIPKAALEEIHHSLVGSRLVIISNCGHFPFVEAPGEFDKAIEQFLR